jgi:hypothetical protein
MATVIGDVKLVAVVVPRWTLTIIAGASGAAARAVAGALASESIGGRAGSDGPSLLQAHVLASESSGSRRRSSIT